MSSLKNFQVSKTASDPKNDQNELYSQVDLRPRILQKEREDESEGQDMQIDTET
jgi:hypothetical protein